MGHLIGSTNNAWQVTSLTVTASFFERDTYLYLYLYRYRYRYIGPWMMIFTTGQIDFERNIKDWDTSRKILCGKLVASYCRARTPRHITLHTIPGDALTLTVCGKSTSEQRYLTKSSQIVEQSSVFYATFRFFGEVKGWIRYPPWVIKNIWSHGHGYVHRYCL